MSLITQDAEGAEAPSPRILIAPDSFKGTATSQQAAEWLGEGVRSIIRDAEITLLPMADGGEGTSSLFTGEHITLPTTDAAGRLTEATYTYDAATTTAFIDVAAASGLPAVADRKVPMTGDTYGTGVLIADAQTRGATRIVLGLGGSATIDGGTGILVALGANPLDERGYQLAPGGGSLHKLSDIDTAKVNIPAGSLEWHLLFDVASPATGPEGAATVFGPQKGAQEDEVKVLDDGLARLCEVAGVDPATPGMGAAGGVAIGITWLSSLLHGNAEHVHLQPGARTVAEANGLAEALGTASLVITGEGLFDEQTAAGKVVATVCEMAREVGEEGPTVAVVAGSFDGETDEGVLAVTLEDIADTREQLIRAGKQAAVAYLNAGRQAGEG